MLARAVLESCRLGAEHDVAMVTGLRRASVASVSQLVTLDRSVLVERLGKLSRPKVDLVLAGMDVVLGRQASPDGDRHREPHWVSWRLE
jgi:mRNA-degrading endonuclease toxin of MazEF toxin-antitoxin module